MRSRVFSRFMFSVAAALGLVLMAMPMPAEAQRRHGRAVRAARPVHPVRVARPVRVVRPVVIAAHVYRPWHGPFFGYPYFWAARGYWGYPGWAPYWWGPPLPVRYGPELAQARLKVSPRDTEVYVDGRLVGVVDDFDGRFQRLRLPPGRYQIELYREGMEPWARAVLSDTRDDPRRRARDEAACG